MDRAREPAPARVLSRLRGRRAEGHGEGHRENQSSGRGSRFHSGSYSKLATLKRGIRANLLTRVENVAVHAAKNKV